MSDVGEPKAQPRAVVFDVGRVLYRWDLRHLFSQMIDDEDELEHFVTNVVSKQWHHQHDEGRPLDEMVPELVARHPQYRQVIEAYRERFNETIPGPVEGTHDLVHRLKARSVPLYALTNFGEELWEGFVPTAPIFDMFDDIVVSGIEKMAKPDAAIYALAERRYGLPPGDLLFVDDKPENIAAARARGWHGHVFTDAATLERALVENGLL